MVLSSYCDEVLEIVLSYVKVENLYAYFITHNLNFHLKFKYNIISYSLNVNEIIQLLSIFPNIVLIGLTITKLDINAIYLICRNNIFTKMNKIVYLKICGCHTHDSTILNILSNFPHITTLILENIFLNNLDYIASCQQLESFTAIHCSWCTDIDALTRLPKLRIIKFPTCGLSINDIKNLQMCKKLRVLEIRCARKLLFDHALPIKHLKFYKIICPTPFEIELSLFNSFTKLRSLNMSHLKHPVCITDTTYKLHTLRIAGCVMKNQNKLSGMGLRHLDVSGCSYV